MKRMRKSAVVQCPEHVFCEQAITRNTAHPFCIRQYASFQVSPYLLPTCFATSIFLSRSPKVSDEASTVQLVSPSNALIRPLLPYCKSFNPLDKLLCVLLSQPLVMGIAQMLSTVLAAIVKKTRN